MFGERHLRHVLRSYVAILQWRPEHTVWLGKDSPATPRPSRRSGAFSRCRSSGRLHHHYVRIWYSDRDTGRNAPEVEDGGDRPSSTIAEVPDPSNSSTADHACGRGSTLRENAHKQLTKRTAYQYCLVELTIHGYKLGVYVPVTGALVRAPGFGTVFRRNSRNRRLWPCREN